MSYQPWLKEDAFAPYEARCCRACGISIHSEPNAFEMGLYYVNDFPETNDGQGTWQFPQNIAVCPACALAQLRHSVPPDRLYRHFWYRSAVTDTMKGQLRDVVEAARRMVPLEPGDVVVDIGANDGTLLSFVPDFAAKVGCEPAENLQEDLRMRATAVIADYWKAEAYEALGMERAKMIFACAMFYDLDDPRGFLEAVKSSLRPDGLFVVQMNYLGDMVVDNISHEHLAYYSLASFSSLAERCGMFVRRVERNAVNGGSIRLFVSPVPGADETVSSLLRWENDRKLGSRDWWKGFQERMSKISQRVRDYLFAAQRANRRIFLLGASTRGNTTLQYFGLGRGMVEGAAERDPRKFGRYTVGTWIPIVDEVEARKVATLFLCLPWQFRDEIVVREREFLRKGGELVFPFPEPMVCDRGGWRAI